MLPLTKERGGDPDKHKNSPHLTFPRITFSMCHIRHTSSHHQPKHCRCTMLKHFIHSLAPPPHMGRHTFPVNFPNFIGFKQTPCKQECIPVGCVPAACCPYLPAYTAPGGVVPGPRGCTWSRRVYLVQGGVPYLGGVSGPRVYLVLGDVPGPERFLVPGVYLV